MAEALSEYFEGVLDFIRSGPMPKVQKAVCARFRLSDLFCKL